jgi:hypothetical protein
VFQLIHVEDEQNDGKNNMVVLLCGGRADHVGRGAAMPVSPSMVSTGAQLEVKASVILSQKAKQ